MKTGRELPPEKFYAELSLDDDFCKEFGKAVLAAGRLESELTRYLTNAGVSTDLRKANLGRLIWVAKKNELLSDLVSVLEELNGQRNYLAHNIHALFHGLIEETVLERTGLLDSASPKGGAGLATCRESQWPCRYRSQVRRKRITSESCRYPLGSRDVSPLRGVPPHILAVIFLILDMPFAIFCQRISFYKDI